MFYLVLLVLVISNVVASGTTLYGRWLTFHGNPDTCITISSKWDEVDTIRVIYDINPSLSSSDTVVNYSGRRRHHIELNGLEPSRRYYYKIQDDEGNDHTDVDSFKTAGPLGTSEPLVLLLVSDFQPNALASGQAERDSIRGFIDTVRAQIATGRCPYPDLILNLGDFVNSATSANWDTFFSLLDTLHELAPLLPTIGNHDGYPKGKNDSSGYTHYFNLPRSRLGSSWSGDHQYVLDYQNVRFISLSVVDANRSWGLDKVVAGSPQYLWLDSSLATTPPEIDHVVETHHVDLIPLPWNIKNGAPDTRKMMWQNGVFNNPQAENTIYDTLRYEYYRDMRPLLETAGAISIEGHAWFCTATTPLAAFIYFGGLPVICCAGGNGWSTNKQSFLIMNLSQQGEVNVDYHKVDTWPGATQVAAGYPWSAAATQRIFRIYQSSETFSLNLVLRNDAAGRLTLSWSPILGAVQYYIYMSTDNWNAGYVRIDSTSSTQYIDSTAVAVRRVSFYRVTADPDAGIAPLSIPHLQLGLGGDTFFHKFQFYYQYNKYFINGR